MKTITADLLRQLSESAAAVPRLRKNHNLHPSDMSRCHRLLNAVEPGTYIRPHRHVDPEKDEAFILMNGRLGVISFRENGDVAQVVVLSRETGVLAVDVPSGIFHTAVSLDHGTVFFEAKAGPYLPLTPEEVAPWAPAEGDPGAGPYLEMLRGMLES